MPINVLRFRYQRTRPNGVVVVNGAITPIPGEFADDARLSRSQHDRGAAHALTRLRSTSATSNFCRPSRENQQFLCQGANYRQHMIESGMDPDAKAFNMIFTKAASCIAPANTEVVKPSRVRFLDYEIELGLVLKRDVTAAQRVTDANLHEFVAGADDRQRLFGARRADPSDAVLQGQEFSHLRARRALSLPCSRRRISLGSAICN